MKSLFKNSPSEEYFHLNKAGVLLAAANGGNSAISIWTETHWSIFSTKFKHWLDEMYEKNPRLYRESYMKEVK